MVKSVVPSVEAEQVWSTNSTGSSSNSNNNNNNNNNNGNSNALDVLRVKREGALSPRHLEMGGNGVGGDEFEFNDSVTVNDVEQLVKITRGLQIQVQSLLMDNTVLEKDLERLRSMNADLSTQKVAVEGANRQLTKVGDELRYEGGLLRSEVRPKCRRICIMRLALLSHCDCSERYLHPRMCAGTCSREKFAFVWRGLMPDCLCGFLQNERLKEELLKEGVDRVNAKGGVGEKETEEEEQDRKLRDLAASKETAARYEKFRSISTPLFFGVRALRIHLWSYRADFAGK